MKPKVSIIIPFYNHALYIKDSLNSALNQTYDNIEVIIVDDGSDDTNKKLLDELSEKYSSIHIIHQENQGPCSAKNNGVSKSTGNWLLFLDSDNILLPQFVQRGVDIICQDENVNWLFGDFEYFGNKTGKKIQDIPDSKKVVFMNPVDNCILIKKDTFNEIGQFDNKLNRLGLEDWDIILSLIERKEKYHKINEVIFKYRVVENSRTNLEANKQLGEIKKHIASKHYSYILDNYEKLFYEREMLKESIDRRIGGYLLFPYRMVKRLCKKDE